MKVSIGLPVYNGANYLEPALESILGQTYGDFELIISDNGSTDGTQEICKSYAARDPRIRLYRSEVNRGASFNFGYVFRLARGEYFKWAAHDDQLEPAFLERCVEVLDRDPGVVLCYPRAKIIDEQGNLKEYYEESLQTDSPQPQDRFRDLVLIAHKALQVFGLIRSSVLARTRLISPYTSSDRVLLGELALYGRFHRIPEYLFLSRQHGSQSFRVYPDKNSRMAWFAPQQQGRFVFPWWRFYLEGQRAIWRTPIGVREKLQCAFSMNRWAMQNSRYLKGELKRKALQLVGWHSLHPSAEKKK
jgi:glycosyltransferase involved in cell wall biosynthesis